MSFKFLWISVAVTKHISTVSGGGTGLSKHKFLAQFMVNSVLVPVAVPVSMSKSSLAPATFPVTGPTIRTVRAMH